MYSYRHIRRRGWNSTALCEQVMALNFDRIIEHMGKVDEEMLGRITEGVCLVLSVLAVFGTATFRKGRKYVRMH